MDTDPAEPLSTSVQKISSDLIGVLDAAAAKQAGAHVSLVSITIDVVGALGEGPFEFDTIVDRKTRTLVFINARAVSGGVPVMTGTAVFSIQKD
ncbi:MAG: acyl-CoA thioesterase domain-containing protein [Pseudomonadota bacterium]